MGWWGENKGRKDEREEAELETKIMRQKEEKERENEKGTRRTRFRLSTDITGGTKCAMKSALCVIHNTYEAFCGIS